MKKLFIFVPIFFLIACLCGATATAQENISLVGTWVGSAEIVTDQSFSASSMTMVVTKQQGRAFYGTIRFGEGTPFAINGVYCGSNIQLTGSVSTFTGELLPIDLTEVKVITGTGSKIASESLGAMTVVYQLYYISS